MIKDNQVILKDNRVIAYRTYGHPEGIPIYYFTGGQSSRIDGQQFEKVLLKLGICLYTFDRPGMGDSTNKVDRTLFDWADDIIELSKSIDIHKVSVFGLSGGGPHALALAYRYPDFVNKISLISSASPWGYKGRYKKLWFPIKVIYFIARHRPRMLKKVMELQKKSLNNEATFEKQMVQSLPLPDKQLFLANPEILKIFRKSSLEAYKNGVDGDLCEWHIYVNDWGFLLKDINHHVNLWYGSYDKQAPFYMGEHLKSQLMHANLHIVDDGGHLSTINNHIEEILEELI